MKERKKDTEHDQFAQAIIEAMLKFSKLEASPKSKEEAHEFLVEPMIDPMTGRREEA